MVGDYYPFGLTMAGISSKALSFGGPENKYKFNDGTELANEEFSDGIGLEWYETPFRTYDPQIGRFLQIDGMAAHYESYTPYNYSLNNPILYNDPTGLEPDPPEETSTAEKPKQLDEVVMKSSYKNKWTFRTWVQFVDQHKGDDFGALQNKLIDQGVDENGIRLYNTAIQGIGYREAKAKIDHAAWEFEEEIAKEAASFIITGTVLKGIQWGYRAYKVFKASRLARQMGGKTLEQLQRLVGGENAARLRQLFGANEKGAQAVLENLPNTKIPSGLTRETMQAYRELITRVPDPRGTQAVRAKILDYLLMP